MFECERLIKICIGFLAIAIYILSSFTTSEVRCTDNELFSRTPLLVKDPLTDNTTDYLFHNDNVHV